MSYFKACPHCGANLDPGEVCDCTLTQVCAEARETFPERFTGKTDREVVAEIASVVKRAAQGERTPGTAGRNRLNELFPPPIIPEIKEDCKHGLSGDKKGKRSSAVCIYDFA